MKILALDNSLKMTGWAISTDKGIQSGHVPFIAPKGFHQAYRFYLYRRWLEDLHTTHGFDYIAFEEPTPSGFDKEALLGIKTRVQELCAVHGIKMLSLYPAALKKFATGNGKAEKHDMQARAVVINPRYNPALDTGADEADATCLLDWARKVISGEHVIVPKAKKPRKVKAK